MVYFQRGSEFVSDFLRILEHKRVTCHFYNKIKRNCIDVFFFTLYRKPNCVKLHNKNKLKKIFLMWIAKFLVSFFVYFYYFLLKKGPTNSMCNFHGIFFFNILNKFGFCIYFCRTAIRKYINH